MTEMVKLGDVGSFVSGGTPSRKHPEYFEGTIPWVSTPVLNGGLIDESNAVQLITEEAIANSATKLLPSRSLLIGIRVGVGKTAVNTVPMCTNQDIVAITDVDEMHWDIRYLSYAIQAKSAYLVSQKQGATITGITSKLLKSLEVKRFDTETQRRRVSNLDSIRSRIDDCESQLVKHEELVKSRFVEMFGNPETNPFGWETATIGELATDVRYGTSKAATPDGEFVYIRMNNMTYEGGLDLSDTKRITLSGKELDKAMVRYGDLLFNRTNSRDKVGKTCVFKLDEPMVIAGYIIRVRLCNRIESEFLSTYLNTSYSKRMLKELAHGAVNQANINAQEMQAIVVPVPPIERQRQFLAFVRQVDKLKFETQQAIEKLQMLYDSLAQEYFGS